MLDLLVELHGFGDGCAGGAILLVFLGGGPIDEGFGDFLPLVAFGAHVADAVAFDLIFCDQLVGAVFEDEAAGEFLGVCGEGEQEQGHEC